MNKNIKAHVGSILVALAGIGTELLNQTPDSAETATPAEPTTDKPNKPGRPKKEPAPAVVVEPPASSSAPAEAPAEKSAEKPSEKPAEKAADPASSSAIFKTYEDARKYIDPITMTPGGGANIKKIIEALLPAGEAGLRTLVDKHPDKLAEFKKNIDALMIG